MVYPMKKLTAHAAAGGQPPSPSDLESRTSTSKEEVASDSEDTKNAHAAAAAATAAPRGLDLLFAATSQVGTKPEETDANGAEDPPTIITVASVTNGNGTATAEGEPGSICDAREDISHEYDADSIKKQVKTFPQVLQEILTTPEYQSIAHWLPDGLSFIIADKQRFSNEILPKYFREALFHSFIRKLNRWGFRRVKSRGKGEESSFAHNNFVREKPWLCLKMRCKSKPSYHKVPSAKKNAQQQQHAAEVAISLANTARISVRAQTLPSSLAAGGMVSRGMAAFSTLPTATAAGSPAATTIQERQYLASIPPYEHQQRIFRERQIIMLQMRQRHQLQVELQRRKEMSSHNNGEHFANSHAQSSMTAQYKRDMLHRKNYYHKYGYGGERK